AARTFTNQSSNSGRKCAHFAIFRVLEPAKALGVNTKNGPAAAAPAASLMKSRRETLFPFGSGILITSKTRFPWQGGRPCQGAFITLLLQSSLRKELHVKKLSNAIATAASTSARSGTCRSSAGSES